MVQIILGIGLLVGSYVGFVKHMKKRRANKTTMMKVHMRRMGLRLVKGGKV